MSTSSDQVPVMVTITSTETGESVEYQDSLSYVNGELNLFNWEEDDYACDCNRELFFLRAKGIAPDFSWHESMNCSDGRFTVVIRTMDGQVVFADQPNEK